MSEAAQRKETQKCAIEKPNLHNARRLGGFYFVDPAGAEFKETTRKMLRKLEVPMPAAMLCRTRREKYRKTKYACIVEAGEPTRKRLEGTLHNDHEDHIAGR